MRYFLSVVIVHCLLLAGCSQMESGESSQVSSNSAPAFLKEADTKSVGAPNENISAIAADPSPTPVAAAKQIVKTANLVLEVENNTGYASYLKTVLSQQGAYISKEDHNAMDDKEQTHLVIKVPVMQFDNLLEKLVSEEVKQLQKSIALEDVTATLIDTRARLQTRKATRDKYLEFLKDAKKVEDVLKIQQEINNIQEDIESAELRFEELSGQARFSTINLTYFEPQSGYGYYNEKPGFWKRMGDAFTNGGSIFGEIFIALITAWPFWLTGLVLYFVIRKYRRKKSPPARTEA